MRSTAPRTPLAMLTAAVMLAVTASACSGRGSAEDRSRRRVFGGDRPAEVHAPWRLTPGKKYPLVVVLHGYSANGLMQSLYLHVSALTATDRAIYIAPDGIKNSRGSRFWNAGPECCDRDGQHPDDVAYLGTLIDDVVAEWPIDPSKIFVIGHSNGAFMAYRMGLERPDLVTGIMALAGHIPTLTPPVTKLARPISLLHLHGSADEAVPYVDGDASATGDIARVAQLDGCTGARAPSVSLDLDRRSPGAETRGEAFTGCPPGVGVELWTIEGAGHVPWWTRDDIASTVVDWLVAHARR